MIEIPRRPSVALSAVRLLSAMTIMAAGCSETAQRSERAALDGTIDSRPAPSGSTEGGTPPPADAGPTEGGTQPTGEAFYLSQKGGAVQCNGSSHGSQTMAWFNTASNWQSPKQNGKVGPGDVIYICGTVTEPAGSHGLQPQASGTSGSPITIKFDAGAILESPVWGATSGGPYDDCSNCYAGITIRDRNYIVVDGGTNGIIQNTANGSDLAYSVGNSQGVLVRAASDIEVKNLTVRNIYVKTATPVGIRTNRGIAIGGGPGNTNIDIHHNNVTSSGTGIQFAGTLTNIRIHHNTLRDHCWQMQGSGSGVVRIYNNDLSDWGWWQPEPVCHEDGIILWMEGPAVAKALIYNNYIHGDMNPHGQANITGFIYCTHGGTGTSGVPAVGGETCYIFNNVLVVDPGKQGVPIVFPGNANNPEHYVINNTIIGPKGIYTYGTGSTFDRIHWLNNITDAGPDGWHVGFENGCLGDVRNFVKERDFNVDYRGRQWGPYTGANCSGALQFAQWQALGLGFDAKTIAQDPLLDATYHLQAGSPAIGRGKNLADLAATLGIPELLLDRDGKSRPAAGSTDLWDAGAYQH